MRAATTVGIICTMAIAACAGPEERSGASEGRAPAVRPDVSSAPATGQPDIRVVSAASLSEYAQTGAPGVLGPLTPASGNRLVLVKIEADRSAEEIRSADAAVVDANDDRYKAVLRKIVEYEAGRSGADLLFDVPQTARLRTLAINGSLISLPNAP